MKNILTFLLFFAPLASISQQDTTVTQTITYHTDKASRVYLVWSMGYFEKIPDENFWPAQTFKKKEMACSQMNKKNDTTYTLNLTLPAKSYITYMIWIPLDVNGDSTDGWDTYGKLFYSSQFLQNQTIILNDDALWMPEKKAAFDILTSGWKIFLIAFIVSTVIFFTSGKKRNFKKQHFYSGLLIASVIILAIVRMQMNKGNNDAFMILGALIQDFYWLLALSTLFYLLFYVLRSYKIATTILLLFFSTLLLLSDVFALFNIRIVEQLGRPLNYQWLYYSDFMNGTDAKNAIAYNLSPELNRNIALIVLSIVSFGIVFSIAPFVLKKYFKGSLIFIAALLLIGGYVQSVSGNYEKNKVLNPVLELLSTTLFSQPKPKLFSMNVSKETQLYIENYHTTFHSSKLDTLNVINHIILFVFESTPKQFVSVYDSTFNVTPNLKKWMPFSTVFDNMYSHIPSTSNSMLTMISGIYPRMEYKSLVKDLQTAKIPTLPGELRKKNWQTSIFSSADLNFGNMATYAKKAGFLVTEDSRTIPCNHQRFKVTNTMLDGLDDHCITDRYVKWIDSMKGKNTFSMFWSNQMHYPYAVNAEREAHYVKNNKELNRYLNALRNADDAFGNLMNALKAKGILNNTLVIVVGDHGEAFATHNQTGHGSHIYEENVHIPGIFYNPVLFNGHRDPRIAGLIDIAPTICHLLGIEKPAEWEGKSLFLSEGESRAFFLCPYSDFLFGSRYKNWKYIFNATLGTDELYDLHTDPAELYNVAHKHKDIIKQEYEMVAGWVQYHTKKLNEWGVTK